MFRDVWPEFCPGCSVRAYRGKDPLYYGRPWHQPCLDKKKAEKAAKKGQTP